MSELFENLDALPPSAMKDEILRLVKTEGVLAALRAAIDVLRDRKAAAPARATMASLVFKLAGYLEKQEGDDPFGMAKMTPDELKKAMSGWRQESQKIERDLVERQVQIDQIDAEDDVDIFA